MLAYVEALRNVPLLLYLFLWYSAIIFTLPPVKQAIALMPGVFVSNSGLVVPAIVWQSGFWTVIATIAAGVRGCSRLAGCGNASACQDREGHARLAGLAHAACFAFCHCNRGVRHQVRVRLA